MTADHDEPRIIDCGPLGKVRSDRIYPVLRPAVPESSPDAGSVFSLTDTLCIRFICPAISGEGPEAVETYIHVSESMHQGLGVDISGLYQLAVGNLMRLLEQHPDSLSVNPVLNRTAGDQTDVYAMTFAGKGDDSTLVSGLLAVPDVVDRLLETFVESGGWPESALLAAAVPNRDRVILANLESGPQQAERLERMRDIISVWTDRDEGPDSRPVSDTVMVLVEVDGVKIWADAPK